MAEGTTRFGEATMNNNKSDTPPVFSSAQRDAHKKLARARASPHPKKFGFQFVETDSDDDSMGGGNGDSLNLANGEPIPLNMDESFDSVDINNDETGGGDGGDGEFGGGGGDKQNDTEPQGEQGEKKQKNKIKPSIVKEINQCEKLASSSTLFVRHIPEGTSNAQLEALCIKDKGIVIGRRDQNTNYARITFKDNRSARMAKRNGNWVLNGEGLTVEFFKTRKDRGEQTQFDDRTLVVKGIPKGTELSSIQSLFPGGKVYRPKTCRSVAFAHYMDSASALKALKRSKDLELGGHPVIVTLKKKSE